MGRIVNKIIYILLCVFSILIIVSGCSNQGQNISNDNKGEENIEKAKNINSERTPEVSISWGAALHTAMLEVPIKRVNEFKEKGIYLNPLSENKYELIENDRTLAILNFIPNKGASEVATLMGQGHLDSALCSNTGILTAIDNGTDIKILCSAHTRGIGLVFPPEIELDNWDEVKEYILSSKSPVKIGYHSPVSAPRMIIESVLKEEGLKVTEDPHDIEANVLLVDLKGINNLIPSLMGGQVDAWVGPSPFPETAEYEKLGKMVLTLEDFPPKGKWDDFPCCIYAVREDVLNENQEIFKAITRLIDEACNYCMESEDDAYDVIADFMGIEPEILKSVNINFTTEPTDSWLEGINIYIDTLNSMNKFENRLKEKSFDEVIEEAFDFSYIEEIKGD